VNGKTVEEVLMPRMFLLSLVALLSITPSPAAANTLIVAEVHAGDLVEFEGGFKVHLTGIVVPGCTSQIGWKAFDFTKRHLEGKRVAVYTWTTDNTAAGIVFGEEGLAFAKISYGRSLSIDIAVELLERGLARTDSDHLPEGFGHYLEIERQAKDQKLGIWANP